MTDRMRLSRSKVSTIEISEKPNFPGTGFGWRFCMLFCALAFLISITSAPAQTKSKAQAAVPTAPPIPEELLPEKSEKDKLPYAIDVEIGYADYQTIQKPGLWYPVWTLIQAKRDIEGVLTYQQPDNPFQVVIPIQVAKGNRKRYLGYYKFDGSAAKSAELSVAIRVSGAKSLEIKQPLRLAEDGEQHILVLAESPGGFGMLNRTGIDTSSAPSPPASRVNRPNPRTATIKSVTGGTFGGSKVFYGRPELLPDDPIALESLDAIIMSTPEVRALTPPQWDALRAWVMAGGRLLLAGGKYQPFIEQSVMKGAFGLSLGAPQPAQLEPLLGIKSGTGVSPVIQTTGETPVPQFLASWPTGAGLRPILGDLVHPLIAVKRAGRGSFILSAAALDETFLKLLGQAEDPARFWPGLLGRYKAQSPLETFADLAEGPIAQDLQRPYSFNLVGAGWVFAFLGLYIVLALPVNWFICGRLRRREWAWPVAIVTALAFAWYGYSSGLRSQSTTFQNNEITFLIQPAGAPSARGVTFSSIFSPRRYSTDLAARGGVYPGRMSLQIPGAYNYNYGGQEEDLYSGRTMSVSFMASSVLLRNFFFYPWSARNLRADFTLPNSGGITIRDPISFPNGEGSLPAGCIVNNTPWSFTEWWITNGRMTWHAAKALDKGTSIALDQMTMATPRPSSPKKKTSKSTSRSNRITGQSSDLRIAQIIRRAIENQIINPAFAENDSNSPQGQYGGSNNTQSFWDSTNPPANPGAELFFIGQTASETGFSPMTGSMRLDKRRGVMLYEACLPVTEAGESLPSHWTPYLMNYDPQAQPSQPYYGGQIVNPYGAGPGRLVLKAESTDFLLIPDRRPAANLAGPLTIAFSVSSYPNETGAYRNSSNTDKTIAYQLAGCPVQVYNVKQQKWENVALENLATTPASAPAARPLVLCIEPARNTLKLAPATDYLDPGAGALTLRIDAERADMLFSATGSGASKALKSGKEIWGSELDNIEPYNQNDNRYVNSVLLKDFTVTLGDGANPSPERRVP